MSTRWITVLIRRWNLKINKMKNNSEWKSKKGSSNINKPKRENVNTSLIPIKITENSNSNLFLRKLIIIYRYFFLEFYFFMVSKLHQKAFSFLRWTKKKYVQISTPSGMVFNGSEVLLFLTQKFVVVVFFWWPILSNLK